MTRQTKPAKKVPRSPAKLTKAQADAAIKMVADAKVSVAANPKDAVKKQVDAAADTGMWMVAVWKVSDSTLTLERTMVNFPAGDRTEAIKLLQRDLSKVK